MRFNRGEKIVLIGCLALLACLIFLEGTNAGNFASSSGYGSAAVADSKSFENYPGGILDLSDEFGVKKERSKNVSFPEYWDWRNVHGENWMTSVKNDQNSQAGWAFGAVGTMEALINLYYNQHLDVDLSEQALVSCMWTEYRSWPVEGWSTPAIPSECWTYLPTTTICTMKYAGVVEESCYPFSGLYDPWGVNASGICWQYPPNGCAFCQGMCADKENRKWKITGFREMRTEPMYSHQEKLSEDGLKEILITKGPQTLLIENSGYVLTVVGWNSSGARTYWIMKGSRGERWGERGYGKFYLNLSRVLLTVAEGPIIAPPGRSLEVRCVDNDGDNYCNWGIGEKPASCSKKCKQDRDCDDRNASLGKFDKDYRCKVLE